MSNEGRITEGRVTATLGMALMFVGVSIVGIAVFTKPSPYAGASSADAQERSISRIVAGTDPQILPALTAMLSRPGGWMEVYTGGYPKTICQTGEWKKVEAAKVPTCLWKRDDRTVMVFERTDTPTRTVFAGFRDPDAAQLWSMAQQRVGEQQQQIYREVARKESQPNQKWQQDTRAWLERNAAQR